MSAPTKWAENQVEFLFILRNILKYDFALCADLMKREFKASFTKSSVIGLYSRQEKGGYTLPAEVVKEVKTAAGLK